MLAIQIFNAVEAGFWIALAILATSLGPRTHGFTPTRQWALTAFLVGFGLSDIWEVFSGSWWKPVTLLALKAICLTGLIVTAALIYHTRWLRKATSDAGA